jgi:hypothetical protein
MYLVLLRHDMDDLPVKLCKTFKEARIFAKNLDGMPTDKMCEVFDTDCSTPNCIAIVAFNGKGDPVDMTIVRDLNAEVEA